MISPDVATCGYRSRMRRAGYLLVGKIDIPRRARAKSEDQLRMQRKLPMHSTSDLSIQP
jgi:hypothetical protein